MLGTAPATPTSLTEAANVGAAALRELGKLPREQCLRKQVNKQKLNLVLTFPVAADTERWSPRVGFQISGKFSGTPLRWGDAWQGP